MCNSNANQNGNCQSSFAILFNALPFHQMISMDIYMNKLHQMQQQQRKNTVDREKQAKIKGDRKSERDTAPEV